METYVLELIQEGECSLDDVPSFIENNLGEAKQIYDLAKRAHKQAKADMSAILAERYLTGQTGDIPFADDEEALERTDVCTIAVTVCGQTHVVALDLNHLTALFPRYRFGFGPGMALKTFLWQRCSGCDD